MEVLQHSLWNCWNICIILPFVVDTNGRMNYSCNAALGNNLGGCLF